MSEHGLSGSRQQRRRGGERPFRCGRRCGALRLCRPTAQSQAPGSRTLTVSLILTLLFPGLLAAQSVAVISNGNATAVERYAAGLLKQYLEQLFGVHAGAAGEVVFLVGQAQSNLGLLNSTVKVSDQGIVIKTITWRKKPAVAVAGGSDAATLWAVAELAEHWGVRFLVHRDVLPPRRPFRLPQLDVTLEPKLR